jgi:hypothetical protein
MTFGDEKVTFKGWTLSEETAAQPVAIITGQNLFSLAVAPIAYVQCGHSRTDERRDTRSRRR